VVAGNPKGFGEAPDVVAGKVVEKISRDLDLAVGLSMGLWDALRDALREELGNLGVGESGPSLFEEKTTRETNRNDLSN
jgi:hypothetical protein